MIYTGGYDSEISDADSDDDADSGGGAAGGSRGRRAGDSDADSSADEEEVEKRRDSFRRKQREILKQVEREERQAMGESAHIISLYTGIPVSIFVLLWYYENRGTYSSVLSNCIAMVSTFRGAEQAKREIMGCI